MYRIRNWGNIQKRFLLWRYEGNRRGHKGIDISGVDVLDRSPTLHKGPRDHGRGRRGGGKDCHVPVLSYPSSLYLWGWIERHTIILVIKCWDLEFRDGYSKGGHYIKELKKTKPITKFYFQIRIPIQYLWRVVLTIQSCKRIQNTKNQSSDNGWERGAVEKRGTEVTRNKGRTPELKTKTRRNWNLT